MAFLQFIHEYPGMISMAIMGGCVATVAVPKKPIIFQLLVNMVCGVFFALVMFFYIVDPETEFNKNKMRSLVGITSLVGTPLARLVLEAAHDKANWLKLWGFFKKNQK